MTYLNQVQSTQDEESSEDVNVEIFQLKVFPEMPDELVQEYAGFKARGAMPKAHKEVTDMAVQMVRQKGGELAEFTMTIDERDSFFLEIMEGLEK